MRGKSALFRLVVRNSFAHFVWKVFARRKLLPGKFWVFVPLEDPTPPIPYYVIYGQPLRFSEMGFWLKGGQRVWD